MFGKRKAIFSERPPLKIMLIGDRSETHDITVSIQKNDYEVILWDTAGVEELDTLRRLDYNNVDCFILCYAINNHTSMQNIETKWIPELQKFCPDVPVLLVGTKTDIRTPSNTWISTDEGRSLKDKIKAVGFAECSSKSIASIEGIFIQAVTIAFKRRQFTDSQRKCRRCEIL